MARDPDRLSVRTPHYRFLTSAAELEGCPDDLVPEIALAGRSNAGKSSFLNALAGGRLAKVSSEPGKTRLLNFFDSSTGYRLVDMPGYGYAKRGADERDGWADMIEPYLAARSNVSGVLIIMDVRRQWDREERALLRWLKPLGIPAAVALTKSDKVNRAEATRSRAAAIKDSGIEHVFLCSSPKRDGLAEIEDFAFRAWIKPRLEAK